jgi:methylaspartate mutase S subunit
VDRGGTPYGGADNARDNARRARGGRVDHLGTVITGTVGVDAHVIGTKIISRALRDAGFNVVELGAQTPPAEFIMAAQETAAEAMLISSLYGMAEMDLEGFRDKCTEAGLGGIILYVGGILGVSRRDFAKDEVKFKAMGFDRVYPPEADIRAAIEDLKGDLSRVRAGSR